MKTVPERWKIGPTGQNAMLLPPNTQVRGQAVVVKRDVHHQGVEVRLVARQEHHRSAGGSLLHPGDLGGVDVELRVVAALEVEPTEPHAEADEALGSSP